MNLGNFFNQLIRAFASIFAAPGNASSEIAEATTLSLPGNTPEESSTSEEIFPTHSDSETIYSNIIEENKIMINTSMLQEILQNFVSSTPDVQGAALVTPDGLALTSVLPGDMDDERTAAMSASMLSLGERIGRELARGKVERIVVEGEKGYGILVGCGVDAVLLVLANSAAKQGLLFLEIKRAASRIAPIIG
ncbi:MAG: roadblock/LC7 domain-containing protein [Nostocaceae cyanobacterium]|nr:roadblock/LC7 domain-containing protein [Nostocaceae cyanobacterium]